MKVLLVNCECYLNVLLSGCETIYNMECQLTHKNQNDQIKKLIKQTCRARRDLQYDPNRTIEIQ